jgi:uncharacterized membrane protein
MTGGFVTGSRPERSADRPGLKILLAGESWVKHVTHLKGFDAFHTTDYTEGAAHFIAEVRALGHELTYIPCHEIPARFPRTAAELAPYDAVILSDVGSNTFLLTPETFTDSLIGPNLLAELAEYVADGGGLLMIGGYMSFAGIDGRARYGSTVLAPVLPVNLLDYDDRVEVPDGFVASVTAPDHPALTGVEGEWPPLLGYNRLVARPGTDVLAARGDDPILVVGSYGEGRSAAFASDLAPHWAPPHFVDWDGYAGLWDGLLRWLAGSGTSASSDGVAQRASASG